MSRLPIRIVKVGGSLLDWVELADRLQGWLSAQPPAHHVLIAGGGQLVEQIRQHHALRPLDDATAHWMCVDLMSVTARILHSWLPNAPVAEDDRLLCQRLGEQACTIFSPASWLRNAEPQLPGQKLPANWDVTSDAIAARLAIALQADELVLLKSALPPVKKELQQLADGGYVDRQLAVLCNELPALQIVNLRDPAYRSMQVELVQ